MFYVIGTEEDYNFTDIYTLFETNTESTFKCNEEFLKELLLKHKIEIKNADRIEDRIIINSYDQSIHHENESYINGVN